MFKIVVLNRPYDFMEDIRVRNFASSLEALKVRGYRAEYPYGVMPIDKTDKFATHVSLCFDDEDLTPIMSYRSLDIDTCKIFQTEFPPLSILKHKHKSHFQLVSKLVDDCSKHKLSLFYDSSWTICPHFRRNNKDVKNIKNIMQALHTLHHTHNNTDHIIAAGVDRFKMERFYNFWGYEPFSINKTRLDSIPYPTLFGEATTFFMLSSFSSKAIEDSKKYQKLWDNRIVFEHESLSRAA